GSLLFRLRLVGPRRESNAQLAILDPSPRGLATLEHSRQGDLAPVVADRHVEVAVVPAQVDRRLLDERNLEGQYVVGPVLIYALWIGRGETARGILLTVDRFRHPRKHPLPHDLLVEQRHVEDRNPGERLFDLAL